MDFSTICAPRISEERKRLKLSQDQAGDFCEVSREMWGKYERAKAAMGSDVLFLFAQAGADAQYILTGIRSGSALAADEQILLDGYRTLDPATRKRMLAFVLTEAGPAEVSRQIKKKANEIGSKTVTVTAMGSGAQAAGRNIVNKGRNEK